MTEVEQMRNPHRTIPTRAQRENPSRVVAGSFVGDTRGRRLIGCNAARSPASTMPTSRLARSLAFEDVVRARTATRTTLILLTGVYRRDRQRRKVPALPNRVLQRDRELVGRHGDRPARIQRRNREVLLCVFTISMI